MTVLHRGEKELSDDDLEKIRNQINPASPWARLKKHGLSVLNPDAYDSAKTLLDCSSQ